MLEKLKSLGEAAKNVVLFILTPIAFIAGIIFYLWSGKTELTQKLKESEAEKDLKESLGEKLQIDKQANASYDDYERARKQYDESGGGDK